ncbi:MAG: hypothetical protein KAW17_13015 [Candidatus Eisenbacteria sp.]|nr:hypothetical protein [Candidatus Eisenbacteria bacterium]
MKARTLLVSALAIAGLLMIGAGCSENETDPGMMGLTSPQSTSDTAWMPSVSDIESAVELTPEQRVAMEAAAGRFRETFAAAVADRPQRGERGRHGAHGQRARFGEAGDMPDHERPFLAFIGECADILGPRQFVQFTGFLAERHEAHRSEMAGLGRGGRDRGRGGRGGFHGRHFGPGESCGERFEQMAGDLNLTEEQSAQVREAAEAMHERMRDFREQCRSGDCDREAVREQAREMREAFRAQLETILTPEQIAQMEEHRAERQSEMMERREARHEQRMEQRIEFLTRVLDLDESQAQQVRDITEAAMQQHQTLRESVRSGEIEFEDAQDRVGEIHEEAVAAIRDLLTSEQQEMFDALTNLLPHHGPRFGHGPGHGVGGPF